MTLTFDLETIQGHRKIGPVIIAQQGIEKMAKVTVTLTFDLEKLEVAG